MLVCVAQPGRGVLAYAAVLGWRCEKAAMLLFGACCACGPDWDFWRLSSRDWASGSCFDCGCWLASLALLALLSHGNGLVCDGLSHLRTRLVYPFCARGSSIPLGHEARLSRLVTRLVYPTWARGSSIPPGHEAHEAAHLHPLGTRLVCPAWARGSSVPLGLRLLHRAACGSSNPCAGGSSGPRSPRLAPRLSGARHAGNRPGPVPNRPEL